MPIYNTNKHKKTFFNLQYHNLFYNIWFFFFSVCIFKNIIYSNLYLVYNMYFMTRRRNSVSKNLKDYMVPIAGAVLVLLLIISIFTGGESTTEATKENQTGFSVTFDNDDTEAKIIYPGWKEVKISSDTTLYKGEEVNVINGGVSLQLENVAQAKLAKLAEMKYTDNGEIYHKSSDIWLESLADIKVKTKFTEISLRNNSVLSISENEMSTTAYLMKGFAEISSKAGKSTVLAPGQKISISRMDTNNEDFDAKLAKADIDDYYKQLDWFVKNNGASYLAALDKPEEETSTSTGSTSKLPTQSGNRVLTFASISDGAQVSAGTINVVGNYSDETVTKITLAGQEAQLNKTNKSFKFENVDTSLNENDLVFRAIDDAGDVLERKIITVYYDGATSGSTWGTFPVKNYQVDASQFLFTAPSANNVFSTTNDFITIKGVVKNKNIEKVTVNGYQLKSYNKTYGTWRYHAATKNNNLQLGSNVYEIKYYDKANKVIFRNTYTIVKKTAAGTISNQKSWGTYSNEA